MFSKLGLETCTCVCPRVCVCVCVCACVCLCVCVFVLGGSLRKPWNLRLLRPSGDCTSDAKKQLDFYYKLLGTTCIMSLELRKKPQSRSEQNRKHANFGKQDLPILGSRLEKQQLTILSFAIGGRCGGGSERAARSRTLAFMFKSSGLFFACYVRQSDSAAGALGTAAVYNSAT